MPTPKPVTLKLNGKPLDLRRPAPLTEKIIKHLDSCPKDEIFPSEEVCVKLGANARYIKDHARDERVAPYTLAVGGKRYCGHPKAIAELKRQTEGM